MSEFEDYSDIILAKVRVKVISKSIDIAEGAGFDAVLLWGKRAAKDLIFEAGSVVYAEFMNDKDVWLFSPGTSTVLETDPMLFVDFFPLAPVVQFFIDANDESRLIETHIGFNLDLVRHTIECMAVGEDAIAQSKGRSPGKLRIVASPAGLENLIYRA